jgi:hypothetical protein
MKNMEYGEIVCSRCNGKGVIEIEITEKTTLPVKTFICFKCNGSGKLTWLENILGKHQDDYKNNNVLELLNIGSKSQTLVLNSKGELEWK